MNIGIVAGEASGDLLASELMVALRNRVPSVQFHGVGGERMLGEGLNALESIDHFAINGFIEPLKRLPHLYRLLKSLVVRLAAMDVVIGVDFNVFNLALEKRLKAIDVKTMHYVSPSVYAWRRNRVKKIARSADVLLTLFPFETKFYSESEVKAIFVGHPLADRINPGADRVAEKVLARERLSIDQVATVFALLPGSRNSEIRFHAELFFNTAEKIQRRLDESERCVFVVPCGSKEASSSLSSIAERFRHIDLRITDIDSLTVFAASDAALLKSGTSTLEALLMRVPMVVAYRIGHLTYSIVKSMLHTKWVALPNILSEREFVPEFLQENAKPEKLAESVCGQLAQSRGQRNFFQEHGKLHRLLRQGASERAAEEVMNLAQGTHHR